MDWGHSQGGPSPFCLGAVMELCCPGCVCHTALPQQVNGNLFFFIFFTKYLFSRGTGVLCLSSVFN